MDDQEIKKITFRQMNLKTEILKLRTQLLLFKSYYFKFITFVKINRHIYNFFQKI